MFEAASQLVPKRRQQRVELALVLVNDGHEVGGCRRTEDEAKGFQVVSVFYIFTPTFKSYPYPMFANDICY